MTEKDLETACIFKMVQQNLGINNFSCEETQNIMEKIKTLNNEEKSKLLACIDKETVAKIKNIIDNIQR